MENEEIRLRRPKCSVCGEQMKYISFIGYYDSFAFWDLNCKCNDEISFNIDEDEYGAYTR